jgi:ABC-2 type transport system ATP-binding protein
VLSGRGDLEPAAERLRGFPGVSAVDVVGEQIQVNVAEAATILPGLLSEASAAGTTVTGVEVREPDLEAVFLHLTGRALRD